MGGNDLDFRWEQNLLAMKAPQISGISRPVLSRASPASTGNRSIGSATRQMFEKNTERLFFFSVTFLVP
ncbi:hypothetical protein AUC60_19430 [Pseudomonas caspiana]|uniref:Uncharacterized protein n=1 Tax=Pseudomonas caspiana TaxID=1451454 RepID=A0A1Y3NX02_9PSED|nr:hypothetical protein AUC60_19430 [Pseudomonas caspiana]